MPFVEKTIPYPLNCLCIYLCVFIYTSKRYSVLLTRLFLHQHHSIFIAALRVLKSGDIGPPPLFAFSRLFWLFWVLSILLWILESAWLIQTTVPNPCFPSFFLRFCLGLLWIYKSIWRELTSYFWVFRPMNTAYVSPCI